MSTPKPLYALTILQPWAWAITHASKRVENRSWAPPKAIIGQWLAIHAGKRFDTLDAFEDLRECHKLAVPQKSDLTLGAIVALAKVTGWDRKGDIWIRADDPWFCGPIGWRLGDVTPISPVGCNGAQGLWLVEGDLLESVRHSFRVARDEGRRSA